MDNYNLVYFDRFGDVTNDRKPVTGDQINNIIDQKLKKLHFNLDDANIKRIKNEINSEFRAAITDIERNLNSHVNGVEDIAKSITVSKNYISVHGKRIVNVGKPIDKHDVIIMSELEAPTKLTHAFDIVDSADPKVHGTIEVKLHRRISKVSKAIDPFDVVVKTQLDELRTYILESLNTLRSYTDSKVAELERWQANAGMSIQEINEQLANP